MAQFVIIQIGNDQEAQVLINQEFRLGKWLLKFFKQNAIQIILM